MGSPVGTGKLIWRLVMELGKGKLSGVSNGALNAYFKSASDTIFIKYTFPLIKQMFQTPNNLYDLKSMINLKNNKPQSLRRKLH